MRNYPLREERQVVSGQTAMLPRASKLLLEFEPVVLANLRPVVGLIRIGTEAFLDTTLTLLQSALAEYVVVDHQCSDNEATHLEGSPISTSSSRRSKVRLRESWIQKYAIFPAVILAVAFLSEDGDQDRILAHQIKAISTVSVPRMQRLAIVLQPSDATLQNNTGRASDWRERKERLARLANISPSSIFITCSPQQQGFHAVLEYVANTWDKFYKDRIKIYKKKLLASEADATATPVIEPDEEFVHPERQPSSPSLFQERSTRTAAVGLRYRFKMAMMEIFLGESMNALRSLNAAYSAVIRHYEKLQATNDTGSVRSLNRSFSEQGIAFLQSVRWTCDVIALRMVVLLLLEEQKASADVYIAGHLQWFSVSHGTPIDLCQWKGKFLAAVIKIITATGRQYPSEDPFHIGYYQYLAAKNGISLIERHLKEHPQEAIAVSDVERILDYLVQAYEQYRERNYRRMTLLIGRLIVSQYLHLNSRAEARELLIKLRLAFRQERWKQIRADLLRELLGILKQGSNENGTNNGSTNDDDASLAVECYWELASLFPAQMMDEFDVQLTDLLGKLSSPVSLDMSMMERGFVQAAAAMHPSSTSVDQPVTLMVNICNMTPLMMSLQSVRCQLVRVGSHLPESDAFIVELDAPPSTDLLPGTFISLNKPFEGGVRNGQYTISSVSVQLADHPLLLIFPSSTLYTFEQVDFIPWDVITTNWKYLYSLAPYFTVDAQQTSLQALEPMVEVEMHSSGTLICGHPYEISINITNKNRHYPVECSISFNGNFHGNLFVIRDHNNHQDNGGMNLIKLADFHQLLELSPNEKQTLQIFLLYAISSTLITATKMTIHLDLQSHFSTLVFSSTSTATTPSYAISSNTHHQGADLVIEPIQPFAFSTEYQTKATSAALSLPYNSKEITQQGLTYYEVMVKLEAQLDQLTVVNAQLYVAFDDQNIILVQSHPKLEISLKKGESHELCFEVRRIPDWDQPSYPLRLHLSCQLPADLHPLNFKVELPAVPMRSRCIFNMPLPLGTPSSPPRVGCPSEYTWRVWNQDDHEHTIVLRLDTGDDYVYMGPRQIKRQIDAHNHSTEPAEKSMAQLTGWLIPLKAGAVPLPHLMVKSAYHGETIFSESLIHTPSFILPN